MSEAAILGFLHNNEPILDSGQFAAEHNLDHDEVKNAIKSLQGFLYIEAKELKRETLVLTDGGKKYAAEGSPEIHFFSAIPEEGSISKDDREKKLDPSVFKIGSTQAAKKRWVAMGKQVSRKVQHVEDKVKESLLQIQQGLELDKESLNSLKTRKLLVTQGWMGYSDVEKGPNYAPKRKIIATDLTRENLHKSQPLCPFAHQINKVSCLNLIPRSLLPSTRLLMRMLRTQVWEQRSTSTSVCSSAMVGKA
ncbi:BnaC09g53300D [Brassica napus]|uniref:BnaC09g53300D protein n=1 Tax=Brassica napus TaxID=3708 RepID=A0A078JBR1_BRANA|nr:BnaC09g53300D [Brassica napus]